MLIVLSQHSNLIVFDPPHLILLDMSWRGWEKKRSGSHGIKTTIHDLLSVSENATCLVKWHTSATLTNDHTLLSIGHIFSKANTHSSYTPSAVSSESLRRQKADGRGQKGKTDRVWQLGWSMMRDSGGQWETGWVTYGGRRGAKLASLSMTCDVMAICILVMIMMMMTTGNDHNNKIKTITQKTIWRCQARLSFCSMTCHNDQKWLGT